MRKFTPNAVVVSTLGAAVVESGGGSVGINSAGNIEIVIVYL